MTSSLLLSINELARFHNLMLAANVAASGVDDDVGNRRMHEIAFGLPNTTFKGDDGSAYMTRYLIGERDNGGHVYLDNILRNDMDPDPHDHPWDIGVWRVVGTYLEMYWYVDGQQAVRTERKPGDVYCYPHTAVHRIEALLSPYIWSVLVTGPYQHHWGFYIQGDAGPHSVKVGHKQYKERQRV